jgi:tetraacyldisaccharide 4'-kinase
MIEVPYAWATRRRNWEFDNGRRAIQRVNVPVISVGNLTLGGTGKTPMVQWLAQWFGQRGIRVALVSRGYKAAVGSQNDEARELERALPGVPHLQNPNRVSAARAAIDDFHSQLILLDDGFQHRRLARDLDIVLLDALEPFGFGHLFPRGTLRESLDGLARAHAVVLTRADMVDQAERARIRSIVEQYAPHISWAECRHAPCALVSTRGKEEPVGSLAGRRVAAFCGLGNPDGFRRTLEQCQCDVAAWREFPDHHHYGHADVEELSRWAGANHAAVVLCTQKDLVKLNVDVLGAIPLRAVQVELEFLHGRESLESVLNSISDRCTKQPLD